MMRRLMLVATMMMLVACQPAYRDGRPNPDSPYFRIPGGSELVIHAPLEVSARSDRVYFQDGQVMPWHEVNRYQPYCALTLAYAEPAPGRIASGTFTVLESNIRFLFHLAAATPRPFPARRSDADGIDDYQVQATELILAAAAQPRVERLICAAWRLPQGSASVTLNHIEQALGDRASLRIRAGTPERAAD